MEELFLGYFGYGKVRKFGEEGGGEETTVLLEDSHRGTIVAGNFGLGARKP